MGTSLGKPRHAREMRVYGGWYTGTVFGKPWNRGPRGQGTLTIHVNYDRCTTITGNWGPEDVQNAVIKYGNRCQYEGRVQIRKKFDRVVFYTSGRGVMRYPNGEDTTPHTHQAVYEGEWKNNLRHGRGKMTYADGSVYDGDWEDDEPSGWGTQVDFNGAIIYCGNWRYGKYHGEGTLFKGDRVFRGPFMKGLREGEFYVSIRGEQAVRLCYTQDRRIEELCGAR